MAVKMYTKSGHYAYPGPFGSMIAQYVDGLSVDSVFFNDNIPILGAIITVTSTRSGPNLYMATSNIFIATFDGSHSGWRSVGGAMWAMGDAGPHTTVTNLGSLGLFFGMGLNMLDIRITSQDLFQVTYNVDYALEVHY